MRGVVVTGAAQGIGRGIAQRFLRDGAGVVAFDVNAERLDQTVGSLGGRCVAFKGDVSRRDYCRRAVELCL
jgi:3-oxoacyl-[acyl-carrier protein] reductase